MLETNPTYVIDGAIAEICLQRPSRHNCLNREDIELIKAYLERAQKDESIKVLVISGKGNTFCSGFDLSSDVDSSSDSENLPQVLLQYVTDDLANFPKPTICKLNGAVYGGGVDLALACDFRIGVSSAKLRMPATRIGICFYPSGLQRAISLLGLQLARRVFLLGEEQSAEDLLIAGFLDEVVDSMERLDNSIRAMCDQLSLAKPGALSYTKLELNELANNQISQNRGNEGFISCLTADEFLETLAIWSKKKPSSAGKTQAII